MTRKAIADGITSRHDRVELRARLRAVDLVAVDIDECLFPGFSQNVLGHLIFRQIVTRPHRSTDLRLVPQLLGGWGYVRRALVLQRLGLRPSNEELMRRYERTMRGIPEAYFRQGARQIPGRSYAGARRALCLLGRRARVGLISFGIHLIAEEYRVQLATSGDPCLSFVDANRVRFSGGDGTRPVFAGYEQPLLTRPVDKLYLLEQRRSQYRASVPLVIGNGPDEVEMASRARELGGLSIGFRPDSTVEDHYDILVRCADWLPLCDLLQDLLPKCE